MFRLPVKSGYIIFTGLHQITSAAPVTVRVIGLGFTVTLWLGLGPHGRFPAGICPTFDVVSDVDGHPACNTVCYYSP